MNKGLTPSSPVQSEPARGPRAPHGTVALRPPPAALDRLRAEQGQPETGGRGRLARPNDRAVLHGDVKETRTMIDNTMTVVGNLTTDPEVRFTASGTAEAGVVSM